MVSCLACGISHKARKKGIVFHRFPKNPEQRKIWLNFIKKDKKDLPKISYLCSQHFGEKEFDYTSQFKVQLRKNAVPTKIVLRNKYSRITKSDKIINAAPNTPNTSAGYSENMDLNDEQNDVETDDESVLSDHNYHSQKSSTKCNISALISHQSPPLQDESKKKEVTRDTKNTISNTNSELIMFTCEKLSSEKNNFYTCGDEFDAFGKNIAAKLRELSSSSPLQYIIAEKLISDVLFHGQLEALTRDSFICVSAVKSVVNPDKFQITDNCVAYSILKRT